ncbi:MAG: pseudouridine synthase [Alphaproteobacteria bacterium]|jgi:23S rRNA pseudouridine2605 synthase
MPLSYGIRGYLERDPMSPPDEKNAGSGDAPAGAPAAERIAKRIARAGLCSRREAERWIEDGRVVVGGKRLTTPAFTVTATDHILVDGKPLPQAEISRLWRYHKPAGLVTTNNDPQERPTIFERLPTDLPRVMTVGRLDISSEGLLLLTNDGELARELELPARAWTRKYRVRVYGRVDLGKLQALADGPLVEGVQYGPIQATLDEQLDSNAWLTVSIKEGKNREVRRVMQWMGYHVNRLLRVSYGPFQLGQLPRGTVEEVGRKFMRDQLGAVIKAPTRRR